MATVPESKNMLKQKGWKHTTGGGRAEDLPVLKMKQSEQQNRVMKHNPKNKINDPSVHTEEKK